jgi:colanic acid/amylovoran biosynthesis glycosyltransferase
MDGIPLGVQCLNNYSEEGGNHFDKQPVVNVSSVWLPITQNWMYHHILHLPQTIESHVVCYRTENLNLFDLPHIHDLSCSSRLRYNVYQGLNRLGLPIKTRFVTTQAKKCRAGIIHSHFGNIGWENLSAVRKSKLKHVVTFYGFDVSHLPVIDPIWQKRYVALFGEVDRVLCEGSHMKSEIVRLGCSPDKINIQHLGVDTDKIQFRPRLWDSSGPLKILLAATFQEKKGIPYALEALGQIQDRLPLEITIIGDANEETKSQQEKRLILAIIDKYRLHHKIRFLSFQPHHILLEEAYRHHIFLSPSVTARDGDTEGGLPVAILEMAASGMIVVSTTHCDIPEAIHHTTMGLLAKERDIEGLRSNIEWLIDHPIEWNSMLYVCRQHIENEYNISIQAKRLGAIYEELAVHGT